jgi:hypothetical protein
MGSSQPFQGSGTYSVLLRVGFTKLPRSLRVLVSSYLPFSPLSREMAATPISRDGIFSVALSLSRLNGGTVRITDHPALRSSDFPPLSHPTKRMLRGATICSPSIPPSFFFPCYPPLDRLIGQSVCFFILLPWDGLDLKRSKFF